ncbi:YraN family protein [Gordonia sinesedis]
MTSENVRRRSGGDRRADIGRLGEDLAAAYLTGRGFTVLERNWRNRCGELDLITATGSTLVIVEVKTRASHVFTDPVLAVTREKLIRMRKLARMWLSEQHTHWREIRFDVVSVQLDPAAPMRPENAEVRHHVGVSQ